MCIRDSTYCMPRRGMSMAGRADQACVTALFLELSPYKASHLCTYLQAARDRLGGASRRDEEAVGAFAVTQAPGAAGPHARPAAPCWVLQAPADGGRRPAYSRIS